MISNSVISTGLGECGGIYLYQRKIDPTIHHSQRGKGDVIMNSASSFEFELGFLYKSKGIYLKYF